ncbi:MAG: hypothetical protein CBC35_12435 [Planctomycetes bacterium TMED75]|nr:MAG: hypothetical protein CBC35_12435 [Planctomycetes bacterium TMED75]
MSIDAQDLDRSLFGENIDLIPRRCRTATTHLIKCGQVQDLLLATPCSGDLSSEHHSIDIRRSTIADQGTRGIAKTTARKRE